MVLTVNPQRSCQRRIDIGVVGAHPAGSDAAFELRAYFSDHLIAGCPRTIPAAVSTGCSTG